MKWWKRLLRIALYSLLAVIVLFTLGTGSPIPLWHIEHLDSPKTVVSLTQNHLLLEDGRKIFLPLIKKLPIDNPLFNSAISNGVEVSTSGDVYGLMWSDSFCGNDPVWWRRLRINLSSLSGALDASGIDESQIPADVITFIHEHKQIDLSATSASHRNNHLTTWDWLKINSVEREFRSAAEIPRPNTSE